MKLAKPCIEDIVISQEKLNELDSELRIKQTQSRPAVIRRFCGGTCTYCRERPVKKLKYDIGDGDRLVEYYCDKCFERWVEK